MKKRASLFWVLAAGAVVLAMSMSALAEEAKYVKAPMSVGEMFRISTFGQDSFSFIGFVDMMSIYACSLASIALIVEHSITIRRAILVPEVSVVQVKTMFDERRFREALEFCQNDPSFVSSVIHAGLIEAANGYEAMENAMQDAIAS